MSRAFCLVFQAEQGSFSTASIHEKLSYSIVYVSTLRAILIMGKYAISKLSIILYHKQTDLSTGFAEFLEKYFLSRLGVIKKPKV